jgi:mono/diheme cytochrome c family protein
MAGTDDQDAGRAAAVDNAVIDQRRATTADGAEGGDAAFDRVYGRERRALAVLAVALMGWGVWYYFQNVDYPVAAGDRRSPIVRNATADIDGAAVYAANCVACHQATGQGLAGVFPPLVGSRWVLQNDARLVQILLYGINGAIEVRGQTYAGVMPAFAQLSDGEIAAVLTHVRTTWGNDAAAISPAMVAQGRALFPDRQAPWAGGAELDATFPPAGAGGN